MFRIKDERFPHKWGFSLGFNEASTLPGSSESSHTRPCRLWSIMKSQALPGCSELWGEPLVAGELFHSSQPLPSYPAVKPKTHSLIHTGTRTHLKSFSKLTPSLLFILLGAYISLNSGFQTTISSCVCPSSSNSSICTVYRSIGGGAGDVHKARFRHLQTGVLSTPGATAEAHRDQLTPALPSHSPGTKPRYLLNLCPWLTLVFFQGLQLFDILTQLLAQLHTPGIWRHQAGCQMQKYRLE